MREFIKLTAFSLILGLSACSEPNPLAQKPLDESARLLFLHAGGDRYRQCMEGQHATQKCHMLYQTMSQRFKREGLAVSPKQVADKALYKRLATRLCRLSMLVED